MCTVVSQALRAKRLPAADLDGLFEGRVRLRGQPPGIGSFPRTTASLDR
jgi:hypothetical protein